VAGSSNVPFFGQRIAVSGSRAVVGGVTSQGLAQLWVLDLTDATNPTVLGKVPTTIVAASGAGVLGVALNSTGTLAVAALGAQGIWIIDLTTPTAPVVRGSYDTPGSASAVALNSTGTVAFVADGTGDLQIINIANPSTPTLAATLALNGSQVDIAVVGNIAYLISLTGDLNVVNVSNPNAPVLAKSTALLAYGARIAAQGTRAAVLVNKVLPDATTHSMLQNWSLADPTNPTLIGEADLGSSGTGKGVSVAAGIAYVAVGGLGLEAFNLG